MHAAYVDLMNAAAAANVCLQIDACSIKEQFETKLLQFKERLGLIRAAGCWLLAAACCVLRAVYYQVCAVCCVLCDVCAGTFVQILAYFCHPQRAPMAPIINTVAVAKTSDS